MTRRVAVASIVTVWLLAGLISFVPISLGLHRPDVAFVYTDGTQVSDAFFMISLFTQNFYLVD